MLTPSKFNSGDLLTFDRAYIDYDKMEELTQRNVIYVTMMKSNLKYELTEDRMYMSPEGKMFFREHFVVFSKGDMRHKARIITYVDKKVKESAKLVRLLTNDFDMPMEEIVVIYCERWNIELLHKQLMQNFPLRYFYGESANASRYRYW